MRILNQKADVAQFFDRLGKARRAVLMLDYDGTLAPFKINPRKAIPYEGVEKQIEGIIKDGKTTVVIISGRALSDLLPLLTLDPLPELWGSHGAERLAVGKAYVLSEVEEGVFQGLKIAKEKITPYVDPARCEFKPVSIAVHWRGVPEDEIERLREKITNDWGGLLEKYRLEIHPFDGGLELRPLGINKGNAVKKLLAETDKDAVVAYLGDDATDEEAFEELGERGLKVLVRLDPKPTKADIQITPPYELLQFLDYWRQLQQS